jgi:type IV pilus assembly protein PilV
MPLQPRELQRGATLVEVLVAMIILAIGLLGLVGLQARLQVLQLESYQRAQALLLLHDMAGRLAVNRQQAGSYVTTSPLGAGMTCPTSTATRADIDKMQWCNGLQGAAETIGTSTKVGAMVGGRGCVESIGPNAYMVTVAWQGMAPIPQSPERAAAVTCGAGEYDTADSPCVDDLCRRTVTTVVQIATLTG